MANELDQRNNTNQTQKVRAGCTVVKELRRVSSEFSLKPEYRLSAAAVEAEKHNPKVVGKEEVCGDQGKGNGKEGVHYTMYLSIIIFNLIQCILM
jgi:hypothetical protein